ncbi:unnamed protein product [Durusdinium trenchii]|uniref:Uncharacterized protein n=2 Tax=Durusdinium trenchii TaxID=1381693 RepID=A0ABP0MPZ7_9DINO
MLARAIPSELSFGRLCVGPVPATVRFFSHSRPNEVPPSKRRRMLQRPLETFERPTGREQLEQSDRLYFLARPTDAQGSETERNPRFSKWRSELKKSKSGQGLLEALAEAMCRKEVDASVIGAAIQKCGHSRWWETLLEVRQRQLKHGLRLEVTQQCIFLAAIASCLKDRSLPPTALSQRKKVGFALGIEVWQSMPSQLHADDADVHTVALGSVLSLCDAIGDDSLPWASEVLKWSALQPFKMHVTSYTPLLSLYEKSGLYRQVDQLLCQMASSTQPPNVVTLGNLVNASGSTQNWRRACYLWSTLVHEFQVSPNTVCYTAHAKVSILVGRPAAALQTLDDLLRARPHQLDATAVVLYLQALLIVCHSNLSEACLKQLSKSLKAAHAGIMADASQEMQQQWRSMTSLGWKLLHNPSALRFKDLLVIDNAKHGHMKDWNDHLAGANYLSEQERKEMVYVSDHQATSVTVS